MIVLVTAALQMWTFAAELEKVSGERVQFVDSNRSVTKSAAIEDAALLLMDEAFLEQFPTLAEEIIAQAQRAALLVLNFAVCGRERMKREIKRALERQRREQLQAMHSAREALSSELKSVVTGILLATELALDSSAVNPQLHERLGKLHELAVELQGRLLPAVSNAAHSVQQRMRAIR